jgi:threonine synthase
MRPPEPRETDAATSWQVCAACSARLSETDARTVCACGGLLDLHHRPPSVTGPELRALFDTRRSSGGSGVWRFAEMVLPGAAASAVSHPEGNTPLIESPAVSRWTGLDWLRLKEEGLNPTGSFKDRGMTVGVTQARRIGAAAVACASTGNTAASMAAYAAQAGLPALVVVPAGQVAQGKLAQSLAYGARTLAVRGDFDACLALVREAAERLGVYVLNSINPFRIEGQKTIVLEMLQQLGWDPPDWIVVPAGNLGNTAAFGKALREAQACGLISRAPRLAAVQAAGAAPFAHSFREGFARRHRVKAETVATAIRIGDPASHDRAVIAIRETGGVVTDVADAEILEAKGVIDGAGVGCEPASAAGVAGTRRLVREGVIGPRQRVVAILTGHLLKDPEILLRGRRPREIEPRLSALEEALKEES